MSRGDDGLPGGRVEGERREREAAKDHRAHRARVHAEEARHHREEAEAHEREARRLAHEARWERHEAERHARQAEAHERAARRLEALGHLDVLRGDEEERWSRPPRGDEGDAQGAGGGAKGERRSRRPIGSAWILAVGGAGAAAAAVFGLAGSIPAWLAELGCILAGAALVLGGTATGAGIVRRRRGGSAGAEGSVLPALIGGIAATALGVLALIGIVPWPLTSGAVFALGAALAASALVPGRGPGGDEAPGRRAVRAAEAAVQALAGVGSSALGVLALAGIQPLWLDLVGVLAVGAALLVGAAALVAGGAAVPGHATT